MFLNIIHDSQIGKYTTVAPNAVIPVRVKISDLCYIGANSTILPEKEIGRNAIIGAGAVVTKDVKRKTIVAGVPACVIKNKRVDREQSMHSG